MHSSRTSKVIIAALACVIIAGLIVVAGYSVRAQSPRDSFVDLLRPYVNKEIEFSPSVGSRFEPIILKEIGYDYILLEYPQGVTHAVATNAITSLTFGRERLEIHMGGY